LVWFWGGEGVGVGGGWVVMLLRGRGDECGGRARCLANSEELVALLDALSRAVSGENRDSQNPEKENPRPAGPSAVEEEARDGGAQDREHDEGWWGLKDGGVGGKVGGGAPWAKDGLRGGVEVVNDEGMTHTLSETIALMREAAMIVGPQGSQMFNAVFSRPAASIVEILPWPSADSPSNHLESNHVLFKALGLRSWVVPVRGVSRDAPSASAPFRVETARVGRILLEEAGVPSSHHEALLVAALREALRGSGNGGVLGSG
jgi:hypothetical protein